MPTRRFPQQFLRPRPSRFRIVPCTYDSWWTIYDYGATGRKRPKPIYSDTPRGPFMGRLTAYANTLAPKQHRRQLTTLLRALRSESWDTVNAMVDTHVARATTTVSHR